MPVKPIHAEQPPVIRVVPAYQVPAQVARPVILERPVPVVLQQVRPVTVLPPSASVVVVQPLVRVDAHGNPVPEALERRPACR